MAWVIILNPEVDLRLAACYIIKDASSEEDALEILMTKGEGGDRILPLILGRNSPVKDEDLDEDTAAMMKELQTLHDEEYCDEHDAKIKLAMQKYAADLVPWLMRTDVEHLLVEHAKVL